jgi:transposase-like protein
MQDALINSIFQPDSLAATQFDDTMQRSTPLEPEKKLMLAVLEDAVMCFQDNLLTRDKKKKQLFDETELWLFEERSDRLFAFASVCQQLNLDPEYVRNGLKQWQQSQLNRQSRQSHVASAHQNTSKGLKTALRRNLNARHGSVLPKRYRTSSRHRRNGAPMTASRFRA